MNGYWEYELLVVINAEPNICQFDMNAYQVQSTFYTWLHTTQQNSNTVHSWLFNCQGISYDNFVNESVLLQQMHIELLSNMQHVPSRLFALLRLYFPHVEFELFAFKDVPVTASTLARPRRHTRYNMTTQFTSIRQLPKYHVSKK